MHGEGEENWIRGIIAARGFLDDPNGERGFAEARSVFKTMAEGKGAFSDYYIQRPDFAEQVKANRRLDEIRDRLWLLFQA